ncbi:N-acetyltransferase [Paenibacillus sp. 1011MAR3C5]|uniref:N-acetyltransferase n=1 Tax=Paenibacillus sp. 1011MAR3C5 TaxID=1675787 RepID=UPI000E6C9036|nr:N-acetyltransferase [Paenibacillus sp. 1011MAR3C5]RJE82781.1 N-acetyltransferase [Paenibacillus sp. 1011MAR3C5]
MDGIIELKKFSEINLGDPFFDTLKEDYPRFERWFMKKSEENAQVLYNQQGALEAFLYMKEEMGPITDVQPTLREVRWLKVGTMKVNPHGTRLGERFIKRILDYAIVLDIKHVYVTVFPKHEKLVEVFKKYGFVDNSIKISSAGQELVLVKELEKVKGITLLDYPLVRSKGTNKHLLAIKPEYHTKLFPDSILRNERIDIIKDVSHTNSIHKVYIAFIPGLAVIQPGDLLLIYRMRTENTKAWYTSVATSICVVEEVRHRREFASFNEYMKYCSAYSVFTKDELIKLWNRSGQMYVIKMTYNIALRRKLNQQRLVEEVGLEKSNYWGFFSLSEQEFKNIVIKGDVYESLIID